MCVAILVTIGLEKEFDNIRSVLHTTTLLFECHRANDDKGRTCIARLLYVGKAKHDIIDNSAEIFYILHIHTEF